MQKKPSWVLMAFSAAGRIAPRPCLLLPSQETFHVGPDEPHGGPIGFTGAMLGGGGGVAQKKPVSLVPCVLNGCLHGSHRPALLGDGSSLSRKEIVLQLYTPHLKPSK